jgi:uncharacterized DUF497 family protein
MSRPQIEGFVYDDENEEKFAAHGLSAFQVDQILDNEFLLVPNKKHRRGKFLVIGRDHGGKFISVPIEPTSSRNDWRPITAWPSKESEIAEFRKQRRTL